MQDCKKYDEGSGGYIACQGQNEIYQKAITTGVMWGIVLGVVLTVIAYLIYKAWERFKDVQEMREYIKERDEESRNRHY